MSSGPPARVLADFHIFARGYLRNPIALFFSLVFPIILIGLFGLIFNQPPTTITLYAENLDHNSAASEQLLSALNQTGAVQITLYNPASNGNESFSDWLGKNSHPVGVVVPEGFEANYLNHTNTTLVLYTNPEDQVSSGIAEAAVQAVGNGFNLQLAGGTPVVGVTTSPLGSQLFKEIDYLVPGLIGFSILTSPMFAMVDISSTYKKDHLFRQLSLTPLTKGEWLTAKILWYIVLTFISAGIMIALGYILFGAMVTISLGLVPFLLLGPFLFVSLGMLAGSVSKTPETAAVIGNVITFPMMFLSGTFFPVSEFPPGLQAFAHVLPLYYVIDGMNQVMLFNNPSGAVTDVVVLLVSSIVVFLLAIVAFKWRDE
jgi:ABC-2 type transport system permease protein